MKKQNQLTNEIRKLQYQLSYSQHVNKELSEQLAIMYEKSGLAPRKIKSNQNVNIINTQNHLQQLYYVQPLLLGYQHKVNLLEQQISDFQEQSRDLTQFAQQIVNENKFLRQELESKNRYILKSQQIGINSNFLKLDNQTLKQKMALLKERISFLQKKIKQMSTNQNINRKKDKQLFSSEQVDKLIYQLNQQKRTVEISKIQLQTKMKVIQNQFNNEQRILNQEKQKNMELESEIVRLKNEIKIIKQQSQTNATNYESLTSSQQNQIASLKTQLMSSQRRQNELFNKNMVMESQLQDKNNKCHNLTLNNAQLQTNNNNIMQMLESYEVKVNGLNKKLKTLEGQTKDAGQCQNQLKKDLELLEWKLQEKEKELQRKQIQWRKQRDRIAKMWQDRIEAMRKALEQERIQLNQQIQSLKTEKYRLQLKTK